MKSVALVLLVLLATPALAQDDACTEAEPCVWSVVIDADGVSAPGGELEGTMGDWFVFEFNNVDEDGEDHTVTSSMDGSSWMVGFFSTVESDPFQPLEAGEYTLSDDVTGDTLAFRVLADDVVEPDPSMQSGGNNGDGSDGEPQEIPGVPVGLLLVGLALLAVRRR